MFKKMKKIIAVFAAAAISVGTLAFGVSAADSLWVPKSETFLGDAYTYFKDVSPEKIKKLAIKKSDVEKLFDVKAAFNYAQLNNDGEKNWLEYGKGPLNAYLTLTPKKSNKYVAADYYVRIISVDGKALNFGYSRFKTVNGIDNKYGASNYESFSDIEEYINFSGGSLKDIYYAEISIVTLLEADNSATPVLDCTYKAYFPGSSKKAPSSISSTSTTSSTKPAATTVKTTDVKFQKTVGTDTATIKWSKFGGAQAYGIYKYNSSTKKYEFVKTVTGTSYTFKNLKAGTKYSYYVAALKKSNGKYYVAEKSKAAAFTTKKTKRVDLTKAEYEELRGEDGKVEIISEEDVVYYYNGKKVS